jgi:hypothetical protein
MAGQIDLTIGMPQFLFPFAPVLLKKTITATEI